MLGSRAYLSIIAVSLFAIFSHAIAGERPVCSIQARLHADGSVDIEDKRSLGRAALREFLMARQKKNPYCYLSFILDDSVPYKVVQDMIPTLQEVGFPNVAFVKSPDALR